MKNNNKVIKYKDALKYKINGRHIIIKKLANEEYYIVFKRLLKLDNKQKKELRKGNSRSSKLVERKHSEFCIWRNEMKLSLLALECLHHSFNELDSLQQK